VTDENTKLRLLLAEVLRQTEGITLHRIVELRSRIVDALGPPGPPTLRELLDAFEGVPDYSGPGVRP
jgi:hypothetical protein